MKKALKILVILLLILVSGFGAFYGYMWYRFHYYWEAEPVAYRLGMLRDELGVLRSEGRKLPSTVPELLQLLPEKERQRFDGYHIIWQPHAHPMLKMRVNKQFGFTLDIDESIQWVTKPEVLDNFGPIN